MGLSTSRIARKEHRCHVCLQPIKAGQKYVEEVGFPWDVTLDDHNLGKFIRVRHHEFDPHNGGCKDDGQ